MEETTAELWPAIGIDLGTTNSRVAIWREGRVVIIPNTQGSQTTPSCVAFTPSRRLIGDFAKRQVEANPTNTIYDFKRLIGRRFADEIVQNDMKLWPFIVLQGANDKSVIEISYKGEVKQFVPEQITAMVLAKMKMTAEAYLGTEVKNAVVTVPAYFNNFQRQATIDAGTIVGLNVIRIINEPTAAAIAYRFANNVEARKNILVFDLGGGTFDVSIVIVANASIEVKATSGDTHLGGVDFDNNMVKHFVDEFKIKHSKDTSGNHRALEKLRVACEKAKRTLSLNTETTIEVNCLYEGVDFSSTISRNDFEMLNMSLFQKCIQVVKNCLSDAELNKTDVDEVILVGGSTRIPKVQELLQEFFDRKELCKSLDPDEADACGAALQAAILSDIRHKPDFSLLDVTPLSLRFTEDDDESAFVIPRHTQIPQEILQIYFPSYHIFPRTIPIISLKVYEGESVIPKENHLLGTTKFEICPFFINIDANSIFTLTKESETESVGLIPITGDSRKLSEDEVGRMVEEAKQYKIEDMENMKLEEAILNLEKFVSNMSDTLSSYGEIKSTYKKKLKDSIQLTNLWLLLNAQLNDARMFEDMLKELQDNFTHENMMKDVKESKRKDMELRKARLDMETFVSNMSDTLSSYGKIKSSYKKKLKYSIQQANRWVDLNSQLNDASMFVDKFKELQENFTEENRMKDVKELEMKDMELRKAILDLEKFVSNMSDTLSSYGKIKSSYKKKLKYSIQQANRWLDLNSQLNDASMFGDKLKELQENFTEENRMKDVKELEMKDMELRKAILDLEKFVSNMSDTLSSYGKIKSNHKKKLKYSIQQANCWLDLNSKQNDARMFEDKLKELQDNFTEENRMREVEQTKLKDKELIKARLDLEKFVSNMSENVSSYGNIKSAYKKMLKDSIQQTNRWLDLNSQLNDAGMFEHKLKELRDKFPDEDRIKELNKSKMNDMELRKAILDLEKFVSNMSNTLCSYGKIKSSYQKKLKDSIQQSNRWIYLNSQLNDARMFEDKLKELQNDFTEENRMGEDKESKMKDMELRKVRLDLENFVSNISDNMSNYYNIKSEDKKKLKDSILEINQWLDLNVLLNDTSKFEDKLKELQDICNHSSDASGTPKISSFFFFSYEADDESRSNVQDQKYEPPHKAQKETFKWLSHMLT